MWIQFWFTTLYLAKTHHICIQMNVSGQINSRRHHKSFVCNKNRQMGNEQKKKRWENCPYFAKSQERKIWREKKKWVEGVNVCRMLPTQQCCTRQNMCVPWNEHHRMYSKFMCWKSKRKQILFMEIFRFSYYVLYLCMHLLPLFGLVVRLVYAVFLIVKAFA